MGKKEAMSGGSANKQGDTFSQAIASLRNLCDRMNERIEALEIAEKKRHQK